MNAELDPLGNHRDPPTHVPLSIERVGVAVCMGAIALITLANVVTRYLSNISLAFTEEYSIVLMVILTLVGSSYAAAAGRHVRVDYFINLLPAKARRGAEVFGLALLLLTFGILVVYGGKLAWDDYRFEVLSPGLGHPEWVYVVMLPICSVAIMARAVGRLLRLLNGPAEAS